ncbi:MAG: twin-arginine translocase TatA/TatE family subunit [Firmicutes bacterium]|nr:twin-arginine translocase TatA/TatE family subunit [Bacillota bacterium]
MGLGPTELIVVLVIALIIFGPGKLPDVGKAIGRGISEFRKASSRLEEDAGADRKAAGSAEQTSKTS